MSGLRAHEDLPGLRTLLEPCGDVDRVTGDERLPYSGNHAPGVDSRAHLDLHSIVALELSVDLSECNPHVGCCTRSSERVVLVRNRQPEDGHDRITDELLDRATMQLEGRPH